MAVVIRETKTPRLEILVESIDSANFGIKVDFSGDVLDAGAMLASAMESFLLELERESKIPALYILEAAKKSTEREIKKRYGIEEAVE